MSWTDWNAHDPGITMLELLAYGLAAFGVAELLSRRVRQVPCGRPCVALVAAGVVVAVAARRAERAHR
ncbi:hypothetical protein [Roseisolibacter agri]|uniref:Uncharacterized protein n=1 Tax=Roseisolibacter agri TaxID=2014610 RepID=A0AA37V6Y5_9BACT|nr:hypothetical protein [Roseisolibacter agri]GLC25916.1 hypothetical protein rosag_24290 [Roseisolibacter agri]